MRKYILIIATLFASVVLGDNMKISQLPLGSGSTTGLNDSFPFVSATNSVTKRLTLYDIVNIPTLVNTYAPKSNPVFIGTVTAPTFIGNLTGTVTGNATNVTGIVATANGGTGLNTTLVFPSSGTVTTNTGTVTLTNKTLTSPVINSPTGLVKADVGLGNVDNTSDATKNSAVATLTNKTLTTPIISTISNTGTVTLPTSTDTLVGRATTDALTNKDYQGGTASNTSRITVPGAAKASLDGLTRKAGTVVYGTDTTKLYVDNGTSLTPVGSGSGGSLTYIGNGDAETDASGWVTYADAAGAAPVDGTGGSPTGTLTRSTSSPLAGVGSFVWTKPASNIQGQGFSYSFTIDSAYQGQQMAINYLTSVASGTMAAGDMSVWIYDVTNSKVIQPSAYLIGATTIPGPAQTLVFQTSSNSTSYRLIFHTSSNSALAYTLKTDNITVGPQVVPVGAAMTSTVSYTPVLTGFGTPSTNVAEWSRVGDKIRVSGFFVSGTPTAVTGRIGLPPGLNLDVSSPVLLTQSRRLGSATRATTSSATASTTVGPHTITNDNSQPASVAISINTNSGANHYELALGNAFTISGQTVSYEFEAKIVGWSSNTIISDSAATRVVAAKAFASGSLSIAPNNTYAKVALNAVSFDTHGSYDIGNSRYSVKVPGPYRISANVYFGGTNVLNSLYISAIYKNGSLLSLGTTQIPSATGSFGLAATTTDMAVVGDFYEFFVYGQGNNSVNVITTSGLANFSVDMIQGPAQIQAAQSISLTYTNTAGTAMPNGDTIIPYATKVYDNTGGAWNGSAFTCPAYGIYSVKATANVQNGSYTAGQGHTMYVRRAGVLWMYGPRWASVGSIGSSVIGNSAITDVECFTGQTIDIVWSHASGASPTLSTGAGYNTISITRMNTVQ